GSAAGERPTVIYEFGQLSPLLTIAARMRSRASRSAVSGRPTRIVAGRPLAMSASTSIRCPRTPTRATEKVRASAISGHTPDVLDRESVGTVAQQAEHVDADLVEPD